MVLLPRLVALFRLRRRSLPFPHPCVSGEAGGDVVADPVSSITFGEPLLIGPVLLCRYPAVDAGQTDAAVFEGPEGVGISDVVMVEMADRAPSRCFLGEEDIPGDLRYEILP